MKKKFKSCLVLLLFVSSVTGVAAQTHIVAHRGYWDKPGGAENSIAALQAADSIGVYSSELDVHLTADGRVVVFHDNDVQNPTTGKKMHIESVRYADLAHVKLANGEPLPTLENYLAYAAKLKCRLVLEVKKHDTPEAEDRCVDELLRLVRDADIASRIDYISFSRRVCDRLHILMPEASVAYLGGDLTPREVKDRGWSGIDYHFEILHAHPEWVAQCHSLGLTVNVWTVDHQTDIQRFVTLGVDFLTTNRPVEAMAEAKR